MIKKLRRKFILIAMLSVTLVLSVIICAVNVASYVKIDKSSDEILSILADNDGTFPREPPQTGGTANITYETPYETRYFTVDVYEGGDMKFDYGSIASETVGGIDVLKEYVRSVYDSGKSEGRYNDFKYTSVETTDVNGNDVTRYIFLYWGRDLSSFRTVLLYSTLISLGGLLIVFVLIIVLSDFVLKPVEESYIKQKSFITNAGHDIKTPLTVINAEAELIEMDYGENEYSAEIKRQVSALASLTDKLVFLSKMEESPEYPMAEFNLSETIKDVCVPYAQTSQTKNITFSADIAEDVSVNGNEELLRRASALLLDNAVKYATAGGEIVVRLKKLGKGAELSFYNTAENVTVGKHDELFERFYRGDKSRNSGTSGNGIGLSVVSAIVQMHKGKITAISDDGKSIRFTVTLP